MRFVTHHRYKELALCGEQLNIPYGTELETEGEKRLKELKIDKADFTPRYLCKICGDTGYDKNGKPCGCMKKFIAEFNN